MKALVGVDALGQCATALDLLKRLDFDVEKLVLLHSVESVMPDGSFPGLAAGGTYTDMINEFEQAGRNALAEAAQSLGPDLNVDKRLISGDPLRNLLDVADEEEIDLIAVGTQKKSTLQAAILGSVTRGLLTASTHSFLAAKGGFDPHGPLTAVFATDHSDYANRAVDLLAQLAPKGIGRLIVMSVVDPKAHRAMTALGDQSEFAGNLGMWAEDRLERENLNVCNRLSAVIPNSQEVVVQGDVNQAIKKVMNEFNADLLILGAQGHGFLERLRSGSVSFHQVVAEDYSVLVLRA